jgi:RND family efflux transporter MFP subunit
MKYFLVATSVALLANSPICGAGNDIKISAQQVQSLGIQTATLSGKKSGEISGLPSQIVVPNAQMFIVSTPLAALVEQITVGVGDHVKKGQPLARLQSPALAEAQRGLLQASVQNQLAQESLSRDEALWKDGIISESRYRLSKGAALDAQAALAERKQLLKLSGMSDTAISQLQSGNNLSSLLTVTSPIEGIVLEKTASAGQRLDAAVPMFKVARLNPLDIEIQAPLSVAKELKPGAAISIPAFHARGKLTVIGRSLTGANQTILLRGTINQGTDNLRPNQLVEASIATPTLGQSQWEVPNEAIARLADTPAIFIETAMGFHLQSVKLLSEGASSSVIIAPLKGNEKIAVRGVSSLKSSAMGLGGSE